MMESRSNRILLVAMATVLYCTMVAAAAKSRHYSCRQGMEYFNLHQGACVPCSACPENTVPHRMCYKTMDTLCLPFGPFEFLQPELSAATPKKSTESASSADVDLPDVETPEIRGAPSEQTAATLIVADESSGDEWFTITLVLTGVLVVACLAVLVLLLVSCYMCKRKQKQREILYHDTAFAGALLGDDRSTQGKMQLFKIVTET